MYSSDPHLFLSGDTIQFAEFVERNIRLYQIRNLYPLRPSAAASWIRRSLAESLRSRNPYQVNLLVAGFDLADNKPNLYWVDYLGTVVEVPFAAHGYGSYFALSLLDRCAIATVRIIQGGVLTITLRYHKPDATLEEGLDTLRRCINEVSKRLVVSSEKYKVKVVDKDGVREVEL